MWQQKIIASELKSSSSSQQHESIIHNDNMERPKTGVIISEVRTDNIIEKKRRRFNYYPADKIQLQQHQEECIKRCVKVKRLNDDHDDDHEDTNLNDNAQHESSKVVQNPVNDRLELHRDVSLSKDNSDENQELNKLDNGASDEGLGRGVGSNDGKNAQSTTEKSQLESSVEVKDGICTSTTGLDVSRQLIDPDLVISEPSTSKESIVQDHLESDPMQPSPSKNALLDLNRKIQAHIDTQCVAIKEVKVCFKTLGELIENGEVKNVDDFEHYLGQAVCNVRKCNMDKYLSVREQTNILELHARQLLKAAREEWPIYRPPTIVDEEFVVDPIIHRGVIDTPSSISSSWNNSPMPPLSISTQNSKLLDVSGDKPNRMGPIRYSSKEEIKDMDYPEMEMSISKDEEESNLSVTNNGQTTDDNLEHVSKDMSNKSDVGGTRSSQPAHNHIDYTESNDIVSEVAGGLTDVVEKSTYAIEKSTDNTENSIDVAEQSAIDIGEDSADADRYVLNCNSISESDIPHCVPDMSTSKIISCSSKKMWLKLCPQLLIVCNEAARRAALRKNPSALTYDKPLSEVYMRERLQYHDLLEGEYVRSNKSPYRLQGFIITTNFTAWRRTIRWTMNTLTASITPRDHRMHLTDKDGSLTTELQKVKRIGTSIHEGYTFDRVCEIALFGGLGCGGALMCKTLSKLKQSGKYDYVVLQSTKIAVRFYEKYGFVRVGAVARFLDNDAMPEIAYRHWSEIVNSEAIEASYMMALRLNCTDEPFRRSGWKQLDISIDEKRADTISSLKSAYLLLVDSLFIRATGSTSYTNSHRELLFSAREFSKSASDKKLVHAIDRCISQCVGNCIGTSRRIIQDELGVRKIKIAKESALNRIISVRPRSANNAELLMSKKDVKVSIMHHGSNVKFEGINRTLEASLPHKWLLKTMPFISPGKRRKKRELRVTLECATELYSEKGGNNSSLQAVITMAHQRKNIDEIKDCELIAMENLLNVSVNKSLNKSIVKTADHVGEAIVEVGDKIMARLQFHIKIPVWVEVLVERRCEDDKCRSKNSYIITWDNDGEQKSSTVILGQYNRGVGREWCTLLDWYSFTVLPFTILDALVLECWFDYEIDGETRDFGQVFARVGAGLNHGPKWRFKVCASDLKKRLGTYRDLSIGILRYFVDISDENYTRITEILKSKLTNIYDEKNFPDLPVDNINSPRNQAAQLWAEKRLNEHMLLP